MLTRDERHRLLWLSSRVRSRVATAGEFEEIAALLIRASASARESLDDTLRRAGVDSPGALASRFDDRRGVQAAEEVRAMVLGTMLGYALTRMLAEGEA